MQILPVFHLHIGSHLLISTQKLGIKLSLTHFHIVSLTLLITAHENTFYKDKCLSFFFTLFNCCC